MTHVNLISFGYLHGEPPAADLTADLRRVLLDPAAGARRALLLRGGQVVAGAALVDLDGRHPAVVEVVLGTPGTVETVQALLAAAVQLPAATVAVGCAGGRHRSVVLVCALAGTLRNLGHTAAVTHRDVHRPRVVG